MLQHELLSCVLANLHSCKPSLWKPHGKTIATGCDDGKLRFFTVTNKTDKRGNAPRIYWKHYGLHSVHLTDFTECTGGVQMDKWWTSKQKEMEGDLVCIAVTHRRSPNYDDFIDGNRSITKASQIIDSAYDLRKRHR